MKVKKYTGESIQDVIFKVKADLGPEAVIIEKRKSKQGGIFGFFGRTVFEVVAALEEHKTASPDPEQKNAIKEFIDDIQNAETEAQEALEDNEADHFSSSSGDFEKALDKYRAELKSHKQQKYQKAKTKIERDQAEPEESAAKKEGGKKINIKIDSKKRRGGRTQFSLNRNKGLDDDNQLYNYLLEQGVDSRILNIFIKKINEDKEALAADDYSAKLKIFFKNYFEEDSQIKLDSEQKVISFIGPTGVGKTTTMAKVASYFTLEKNKRVALITADTYRIAAVEQLRTYSNIIDIPFAVCYQSSKLKAMLNNQFSACDLVLIDTPGSSWKNEMQLDELREYTSHEFIDEVHLLLSLSTKRSDLYNIIDKFSPLEPDKIIFTKLDETTSYGDIINIKENYQLPFSYLTYGQDVPEDIDAAEAENLFAYIFGDFYE
ncbi:MAG: flagellar biosynthesis protein FlhF [Halanaerobium sp.]